MPLDCHTLIVGAGSTGCVLAARLTELGVGPILLVEAGPDYGARGSGRWPSDLLDYRTIPTTHDWGLWNEPRPGGSAFPLSVARVIGGSSSHNACGFGWVRESDWDAWTAVGGPAWSHATLQDAFRRVESDSEAAGDWHGRTGPVPVTRFPTHDLMPFFEGLAVAARNDGLPLLEDTNDPHAEVGIGRSVWNIGGGHRWNAAFAYLDSVRGHSSTRILDRTIVDRVVLVGSKVRGVVAIGVDGPIEIRAEQVVLSAGAYQSPAILLRSGVGPPDSLGAAGIVPRHQLEGVGAHLLDHPVVPLRFVATERGVSAAQEFAESVLPPRSQLEVRARSGQSAAQCDLHLSFPAGNRVPDGWEFIVRVGVFKPASSGYVRLQSADPRSRPRVDSRYFSDPDSHDLSVMRYGVELARNLMNSPAMQALVSHERWPGPGIEQEALTDFARANAFTFHHPVGTCKMGPASDAFAVVDERGRVHGIDGLYVADASIMPDIPAAVINLTCMAIGEIIAQHMAGIAGDDEPETGM